MAGSGFLSLIPALLVICVWIPVLVVYFMTAGRIKRILAVLEDIKDNQVRGNPT